ncbi:hypothetical protein [Cryptosporangium sp. NPDC048952]|uniref:hypothetical protein n=1 Tax=Cryptosporangium sp. NPDC048952 TaxID=3363961 RepID=UPI0037118025
MATVLGRPVPSDVPLREIDGVPCTTRAGIARLAGWPEGWSAHVRAGTDPAFPRALPRRAGGAYWYRLPDVETYLAVLAERARRKKPPAAEAGDPDELLDSAGAATALHLTTGTLRSYIRHSRPYWTGEKTGRPLLPPPDEQEETVSARGRIQVRRYWFRRTLAAHQGTRPGRGTGAGRPRTRRDHSGAE